MQMEKNIRDIEMHMNQLFLSRDICKYRFYHKNGMALLSRVHTSTKVNHHLTFAVIHHLLSSTLAR